VVVVHDRVDVWAEFRGIGVEEPEGVGEGVKMDAAVDANILLVSFNLETSPSDHLIQATLHFSPEIRYPTRLISTFTKSREWTMDLLIPKWNSFIPISSYPTQILFLDHSKWSSRMSLFERCVSDRVFRCPTLIPLV